MGQLERAAQQQSARRGPYSACTCGPRRSGQPAGRPRLACALGTLCVRTAPVARRRWQRMAASRTVASDAVTSDGARESGEVFTGTRGGVDSVAW
jgi:hypothetical protein